jgi:thiamine pyrophosphate-dependent acetolactate synthase large subunit-like protein
MLFSCLSDRTDPCVAFAEEFGIVTCQVSTSSSISWALEEMMEDYEMIHRVV